MRLPTMPLVHRRQSVVLGLAALGSGGALVATIVFGLPLWATLLAFAAAGALMSAIVWSTVPSGGRAVLAGRVRAGLLGGALATLSYDAARYGLVTVGGLRFHPFEAFPVFGRSIAGATLDRPAAFAVGTVYHCVNGLLFGVAYALLFRGAPAATGVLFAAALEAAVLALYPGWLHITALRGEFTVVSLVGHLAFGAVLGVVVRRRLGPRRA